MTSKTYLPLVLLIGSLKFGIAQQYDVSYELASYVLLDTSYLLNESNFQTDFWDSKVYDNIPIGFSYEIGGEVFDSLMVAETGYVEFNSNGDDSKYIYMFNCPLEDFNNVAHLSPIIYYTLGSPGNKVFICEFVKKGFVNDTEKNDYVGFQLWLYENCNDFEVRIAYSSIESSELDLFYPGFSSPIIGYGNSIGLSVLLQGDCTSPQLQQISSSFNSLSSLPPSGSVYHFTKCANGISESNPIDFSVQPNPTNGTLVLKCDNMKKIEMFQITNMQGQILNTHNPEGLKELNIDISAFSSGIYLINACTKKGVITQKIFKQ